MSNRRHFSSHEKGKRIDLSAPITPDPFAVDMYWDIHTAPLPGSPHDLAANIDKALKQYDSRFKLSHMITFGSKDPYIPWRDASYIYAPNRPVICTGCLKDFETPGYYFDERKAKIRDLHYEKAETTNMMMTRKILGSVRGHRIRRSPIPHQPLLIVTADKDFKGMLEELHRKHIIVFLALPTEAPAYFHTRNIDACWFWEEMALGRKPFIVER